MKNFNLNEIQALENTASVRDKWMRPEDFAGLLFVQSITCDGATAHIKIRGRDCLTFDVTVEAASCDALSFGREDYDGDTGVYESGYVVTIDAGDPEGIEAECTFRELRDVLFFIDKKTCPEGYVNTELYVW